MTVLKSTFILLLTITLASMTILGCSSERQTVARHNQPALHGVDSGQDRVTRTRVSRPYGKIRVPAELFADLIEPEHAADPVSIMVSASTSVAAIAGVITLRVPQIGAEPGRTEALWAGDSSSIIAEVKEYTIPTLPVGRYHFVAVIEFTPDQESAETLVLSESLYVDVRPDVLLSSNVSFRQIERLALYRKLKDRVLENLNPESGTANLRTTTRHQQHVLAANPDLVEREIARLRATDPDAARQIMALNSSRATTESDPDTVERSHQGRAVLERVVPVR